MKRKIKLNKLKRRIRNYLLILVNFNMRKRKSRLKLKLKKNLIKSKKTPNFSTRYLRNK